MTVKEEVQQLVNALPESVSWEDAYYAIYVRYKIERGRADAQAGRVTAHEEVMKEFLK